MRHPRRPQGVRELEQAFGPLYAALEAGSARCHQADLAVRELGIIRKSPGALSRVGERKWMSKSRRRKGGGNYAGESSQTAVSRCERHQGRGALKMNESSFPPSGGDQLVSAPALSVCCPFRVHQLRRRSVCDWLEVHEDKTNLLLLRRPSTTRAHASNALRWALGSPKRYIADSDESETRHDAGTDVMTPGRVRPTACGEVARFAGFVVGGWERRRRWGPRAVGGAAPGERDFGSRRRRESGGVAGRARRELQVQRATKRVLETKHIREFSKPRPTTRPPVANISRSSHNGARESRGALSQ